MSSESRIQTIIRPGKLIDGVSEAPLEGMAVGVADGKIAWVGRRGELAAAQPDPQCETLDFPDATLLPGLFDCHTHTNMPADGRTGEEVHQDTDDGVRLLQSARNIGAALATGVTTLCDCGSWNDTGFWLKRGLALGLLPGPRTLVSGPPLTITGGHLWFMGGAVDGVSQVRQRVRRLVAQGADFIKIAASGGSTLTSDPYRPAYSRRELQAIVGEAHDRGKPVLAHCRSTESINYALDAGVDAVLHCFFYEADESYRYDEATAARLAESEVWVNPTLHLGRASRAALQRTMETRPLTAAEQVRWDRSNAIGDRAQEQMQRMVAAGVKFIGGSDCGWGSYPFGDFQGELITMGEGGLPPMQAILAGTSNAAAALGCAETAGRIAPGRDADLLVVAGDPCADLRALRQVEAVFQRGRPVAGAHPAAVTG